MILERKRKRERELVGFLLFVLVEGFYSAKDNSIIVLTNHFDLICKLTCHDVWPSSHLSLQPIDGLGLCVVISWYGLESWKMSYPPFPCQDMNDYSCQWVFKAWLDNSMCFESLVCLVIWCRRKNPSLCLWIRRGPNGRIQMVACLRYPIKCWDWKVTCGMTCEGEPLTMPPLIYLPMLG